MTADLIDRILQLAREGNRVEFLPVFGKPMVLYRGSKNPARQNDSQVGAWFRANGDTFRNILASVRGGQILVKEYRRVLPTKWVWESIRQFVIQSREAMKEVRHG